MPIMRLNLFCYLDTFHAMNGRILMKSFAGINDELLTFENNLDSVDLNKLQNLLTLAISECFFSPSIGELGEKV